MIIIGTPLVDVFFSNHLSGPAADDGELINLRAVFISALIMSNFKPVFLFSGYEVKVFINTD